MYGEHGVFDCLQPLRLLPLASLKHVRHVLLQYGDGYTGLLTFLNITWYLEL